MSLICGLYYGFYSVSEARLKGPEPVKDRSAKGNLGF